MYRTSAGSAVAALTHRNILKNLRNPDIIVFATAAPVAFALLFAFVFGSAMEMDGAVYREYLLVGIIAQTMLTTATNTGVGLAHDARPVLGHRLRRAQSAIPGSAFQRLAAVPAPARVCLNGLRAH